MMLARESEIPSAESKRPATIRRVGGCYAVAVIAVLVAFGLNFLLVPLAGYRVPLILFVGASLAAAWYGGSGPGVAAMIAGFLLSDFFFIPPVFRFGMYSMPDLALLLIYGSVTSIGLAAIGALHRTQRREEKIRSLAKQLEREVQEHCQTEERLRASEERLRLALEQLSRSNEELEQRIKERTISLKESIQSLEGLLYHVAHDLRGPLRAMHSFTDLLMEDYAAYLDSRGKDYGRRIAEASGRMDQLIRDLLSYGSLGHQNVFWAAIDLSTLLERLLDGMELEIKNRRAEIQVGKHLPKVWGDVRILEQVLTNLLTNALKFVSPGVSPHIHIEAKVTGGTVQLTIQDNGIGIKPEYRERIFKVFERLQGSEDVYPGTGIGLAIVKKGMERLHGRVGVESKPGCGSEFWLELKQA